VAPPTTTTTTQPPTTTTRPRDRPRDRTTTTTRAPRSGGSARGFLEASYDVAGAFPAPVGAPTDGRYFCGMQVTAV
jgi:hypothetical protein